MYLFQMSMKTLWVSRSEEALLLLADLEDDRDDWGVVVEGADGVGDVVDCETGVEAAVADFLGAIANVYGVVVVSNWVDDIALRIGKWVLGVKTAVAE